MSSVRYSSGFEFVVRGSFLSLGAVRNSATSAERRNVLASVYQRNGKGKWLIKFKDGRGSWRSHPTTARNKTEAKRLGRELELETERQRMGLEPLPLEGQGTLASTTCGTPPAACS
jgi:hypothetical protein